MLGLTSNKSTSTQHTSPPLVTKQNLEEFQVQGTRRILLAEDNIVNQKVAVKMLSKLGYQTDVVANGHEALTALNQRPYDLIFMDCHMPEMDGYEATIEIRKTERTALKGKSQEQESEPSETFHVSLHPSHSRIPIIALTANTLKGDREKCLAAGMDDFLPKPVKLADLEHMLNQWLFQEEKERLPTHASTPESPDTLSTSNQDEDSDRLCSLNPQTLASLRNLGDKSDPEFLTTLITQFLEDLPRNITNVHTALDQADPTALQKAAHALKSSAKTIGAEKLASFAFQLETLGKMQILDGAQEELVLLKEESRQVEGAARSEIFSAPQ